MKRRILIPVIGILLIVILFLPIPGASYDDGGTREYNALLYKAVHWKKIVDEAGKPGIYESFRFYFFGDKNKTIDELWKLESTNIKNTNGPNTEEFKEEWLD